MSTIEKFMMGVVGIALVTTLILPKRQTPQVIGAATGFVRGTLATAMGTGKKVWVMTADFKKALMWGVGLGVGFALAGMAFGLFRKL
jgi:hypothetical protein